MKIRTCVICAEIFEPRASRQKTCSEPCSQESEKRVAAIYKARIFPKTACAVCGNKISKGNKRHKTCSVVCETAHRKNTIAKYKQTDKYKNQQKSYRDQPHVKADLVATTKLHKQTPQYKAWMREYHQRPNIKLARKLRHRFLRAVKAQSAIRGGSAVRHLGCSIEEFRSYIEHQFQSGMSWENHGRWHLDHILPLASFDLGDPESCKVALHYTNYQPLWADANLSKNASLTHVGKYFTASVAAKLHGRSACSFRIEGI